MRAVAAFLLGLSGAPAWAEGGALTGQLGVAYQHASGGDAVENAVTADLRVRVLAGERVAACLGADGRSGLGGGEAVYAAALYPLGLGLRYGKTSEVALCAGVGVGGGSGGAMPLAWTLPVEIFWEGTGAFGLLRPLVVARAVRVLDGEAREGGAPLLSFVDELHAAAGLRLLLPDESAPEIATGDGFFLGVTYDEMLGARILGVAIGYAIAAHR